SIQDLNVTPTRIRVRARCNDYRAYEVTRSWLAWLERELSDQAARWAEIRPAEDFGELPREREIAAELEGLIDLGPERPRFELDRAAILDLVRGANVYTQEMVFVRELVQNAIDATLLRAFEEHGPALTDLAALRERMADYPITVRFRRQGPGRPGPDDEPTVRWTITVEDRGIGISRDDIRWILNVGSSRRNAARNAVIRRMPEWMRPSGVFGIGLQSVAMKAGELALRSRRWRTSEAHELRIRFGDNPEDDEILAWPLDGPRARALDGTVAEVTLEIPRVADHSPWGGSARLQAVLAEHDPLVDDELPLDVHYGLDIASELVASSTAWIEVWHEDHCVARPAATTGAPPRWFDAEACVEVRRLEPRYGVFPWSYYRGAKLERQRFWWAGEWNEFFGASLDFMFGTAQQVLSISRERARQAAWPQLRDRASLALLSVLPRWLEHLHQQGHEYLGLASVGAKLLLEEQPRQSLRYWHEAPVLERLARLRATVDQQGAWEEPLVLAHPSATLRMGELWRMPELRLRLDHRGGSRQATWLLYHQGRDRDQGPEGTEGTWQEAHGWVGHVFLAGWSGKTYLRQVEPGIDEYAFTKGERHRWVVALSGLDGLLWDLGARAHSSVPRYVIPLVEGFEALEISGYDGDTVDLRVPLHISWFLDHHHDFLRQHPMLCPFVGKGHPDRGTLQLPALDRVVEATVRWSAHGHTRAQVIEALGRFIRTAHEQLEAIWGERIGYDPAAALAELARL
ncbi:MAG: ATP-binding protein, partial [Myxococcales bacterium]|nr:ATP-binding protein [Myxococcales bacterium]